MFNAIKAILTGNEAVAHDTTVIDRLKKQSSKLEQAETKGLDSINHKNQAVLVSSEASQGRNHWPQMKQNGSAVDNGLWGRVARMQPSNRYDALCAVR